MLTVLGISPGARSTGIAVLQKGKLIDWKIQVFQGAWSDKKLQKIMQFIHRYVERNNVSAVAIKIPDELPVSANYIQLVGTINVFFERMGIKPMYYTLSDLKKHYCPKEKINKAILKNCIVAKYPDLLPEFHNEQSNRNSYYEKVFEAVASARMYQHAVSVLPK